MLTGRNNNTWQGSQWIIMSLWAIVSHWWTFSHSQKSCFCEARGKNTFGNTEASPWVVRVDGSTVRIQLYLPHTAAWTALKCLQGQTLLLSASVPYACKLCSGVFLLELKFGYGTSSSSSCFPSHQHTPHWSHGSSTAQGFKWRQKRLKSVQFHPSTEQLAKWKDHCPPSLGEGAGAQFGCAPGGTWSHWSCHFALSYGTWEPMLLEKSKHRWS